MHTQPTGSAVSAKSSDSFSESKTGGPAFTLADVSQKSGFKLWTLTFDLPGEKVNKLSRAVIEEFGSLIEKLEKMKGQIDALILKSGKPGNFVAGADIEMIQATKNAGEAEALSRTGQVLLDHWEDLPFVTVAVINGNALGGGCELSLGCSAILMSNDPAVKIGLPETLLGVVPGMGGCVRLPRKVGIATALDLILAGKTLNGERAAKAGLIEACLPKEDFETSAVAWVKQNLKVLQSGSRLAKEPKLGGAGGIMGALLEKTPMGRSVIFKKARSGVLSKTRGQYPAPLEVIEIMKSNGAAYGPKLRGETRNKAMKREARGFGKMAATEISKNLIRLFFLTESVKKSKGVTSGSSVQSVKMESAAVLGAGVMGGGVAQLFAEKNIHTRMKDLNSKALALGIASASKVFKGQLKKKRINSRQFQQKMNFIAPVLDYSGFRSAQIVVEAVLEKMDVKQKVFQELEGQVSESCVIASNTSSLSITEMQKVMKKPERFGGMHFFNPVSKMPLVEVIRGAQTSDQTVSTIYQFSKQLGKTPIVVKDSPGFLVNRLLAPYMNEATWCLGDGAGIEEIDQALLEFGMPMGPMELIDEVGVDVGEKVAHILNDAFGPRMLTAPYNSKILAAGRLGKKSGKGFYVYDAQGRNKELKSEIYGILGVTPNLGKVSREEIIERCVFPMINEASRCLEEGVVATASEVDLGMIMGTGFPPFRGGLLRYADSVGAKRIVERLKEYQKRFGARYEPAPALLARAQNDQLFYS
ncbi:MAG: enoyl-CoA hydratase/isomerase family protein [Methylotenera sp.]|nr:enoyl-CoA hydratase/isomerase family protein [Oligoflexia bacterium]